MVFQRNNKKAVWATWESGETFCIEEAVQTMANVLRKTHYISFSSVYDQRTKTPWLSKRGKKNRVVTKKKNIDAISDANCKSTSKHTKKVYGLPTPSRKKYGRVPPTAPNGSWRTYARVDELSKITKANACTPKQLPSEPRLSG